MATPTTRGGVKIRKRLKHINDLKTSKYNCPVCKKKTIARMQYGVWACKSCGATVAGGAWALNTGPGKENLRKLSLLQKNTTE
ncbi:50S ribosomal protein L37ae [Candidatus Micrarchaeota archaeon]|jgi:large subunit ribosomal protein L37Ae|nr:50S ribosomal protein L37ae [Candidatus Micrarchaeota archaeon]